MKARELAELLMQHPEVVVCVSGYEGGVDIVETVILTEITYQPGAYTGDYRTKDEAYIEDEENPPQFTPALYVGRAANYMEGTVVKKKEETNEIQ